MVSNILNQIKEEIKSKLPEGAFSRWIMPLEVLNGDGDRLVIGCANKFTRDWVDRHFGPGIREALGRVAGPGWELDITVAPSSQEQETEAGPYQPELPYQPGWLFRPRSGFNPTFTFDSFVTGPSNLFAHRAAKAIAERASLDFQTLYIKAGTGLGKSHLSQAVGQRLQDFKQRPNVIYLNTEDFLNQMTAAIRTRQVEQFKRKFRTDCDVLILEEVHFLTGKVNTQSELSHTLDSLLNDGKRIVFSGSRLPDQIPGLKKDLASRLSSGLVATIDPPDFETRFKIVKSKARLRNLEVPDEVAELLAESAVEDVRKLESALNGIVCRSRLLDRPVCPDLAREVLGGLGDQRRPDPRTIMNFVCHYYKISTEELASKSRLKKVTEPRAVFFFLCRQLTNQSLVSIGQTLGRNHSTVLYSLNRVDKALSRRTSLGRQVQFLSQRLKERFS